jgi:hypothetical protein
MRHSHSHNRPRQHVARGPRAQRSRANTTGRLDAPPARRICTIGTFRRSFPARSGGDDEHIESGALDRLRLYDGEERVVHGAGPHPPVQRVDPPAVTALLLYQYRRDGHRDEYQHGACEPLFGRAVAGGTQWYTRDTACAVQSTGL